MCESAARCAPARALMTILLIGVVAACGCAQHATPRASSDPATRVVLLLKEMPAAFLEPTNEQQTEHFVNVISKYDLDVIRSGIERYHRDTWAQGGGAGVDGDWKLYILTKYLFNLPATVRRDSPNWVFFGGWIPHDISGIPGHPQPSDEVDYRWPWASDEHGVWHLSGTALIYKGEYRPLDAFDFYSQRFGRRAMPGVWPATQESSPRDGRLGGATALGATCFPAGCTRHDPDKPADRQLNPDRVSVLRKGMSLDEARRALGVDDVPSTGVSLGLTGTVTQIRSPLYPEMVITLLVRRNELGAHVLDSWTVVREKSGDGPVPPGTPLVPTP